MAAVLPIAPVGESRGVGFLHVEQSNGCWPLRGPFLRHAIFTRRAIFPEPDLFVVSDKELLDRVPKYGFVFYNDVQSPIDSGRMQLPRVPDGGLSEAAVRSLASLNAMFVNVLQTTASWLVRQERCFQAFGIWYWPNKCEL